MPDTAGVLSTGVCEGKGVTRTTGVLPTTGTPGTIGELDNSTGGSATEGSTRGTNTLDKATIGVLSTTDGATPGGVSMDCDGNTGVLSTAGGGIGVGVLSETNGVLSRGGATGGGVLSDGTVGELITGVGCGAGVLKRDSTGVLSTGTGGTITGVLADGDGLKTPGVLPGMGVKELAGALDVGFPGTDTEGGVNGGGNPLTDELVVAELSTPGLDTNGGVNGGGNRLTDELVITELGTLCTLSMDELTTIGIEELLGEPGGLANGTLNELEGEADELGCITLDEL